MPIPSVGCTQIAESEISEIESQNLKKKLKLSPAKSGRKLATCHEQSSGLPSFQSTVMRLAATLVVLVAAASGAVDEELLDEYDTLKKLLRELSTLGEISGVLHYDSQCFMPSGAADDRAEQARP